LRENLLVPVKTPKIALLLAGVLLLTAVAPAQQPACQVTVAGQALALHPFAQGAFGVFELAQPAEIVVHTDFDVRWVDIRPKSSGAAAVIGPDHHTVRFRLGSALPVTVEFNRDLVWVLHLFAYAPEEKAERARFRGHVRNIRVTNLHVVDGSLPYSILAGFDAEHTVENVLIEGLRYLDKPIRTLEDGKFALEYAPGFELRN
jgi:hypothetical protein